MIIQIYEINFEILRTFERCVFFGQWLLKECLIDITASTYVYNQLMAWKLGISYSKQKQCDDVQRLECAQIWAVLRHSFS